MRPWRPALTLALVAACSSPPPLAAPSPSTAHCGGGPSPLVSPTGAQHVALAWPIGIRAFAESATDAVVEWTPGDLQLVGLIQIVPSAPAFSLRGHRCADGHALRFSYGGLPPVTSDATRPLPSALFETAGTEVVAFEASDVSAPGTRLYLGYMLFSSQGDWEIQTFSADGALGTAVLRVTRRAP